MKNAKKCLQILLIILIVCTIAFIFNNSLMPPDESGEQSSAVAGLIEKIFPAHTSLGAFIQKYIRKIAHFAEYGLLGIEIALYVIFYSENKHKSALINTLTPFAVGFADETIQIFSGRGPQIVDVWIDASGFITCSAITYAIFAIAFAIKGNVGRKS